MLFIRTLIIGFFHCLVICNALQCLTNCFYTSNVTTPLLIPAHCNQTTIARFCTVFLQSTGEEGTYTVSFSAWNLSSKISPISIRTCNLFANSLLGNFFLFSIYTGCQDKDDCSRELARNLTNEINKRQYDFRAIWTELAPLFSNSSSILNNSDLSCYDRNETIHQCGSSTQYGLCRISNDIYEKKNTFSCSTLGILNEISVYIHQYDGYSATFDLHCNRSLCNDEATLNSVKGILFKHGVTATLDGRLVDVDIVVNHGSKILISFALMIISFVKSIL
ncbi:hypothetical protein I4U23_028686 [Adineta vaga]|nr:hypothetical protein I4U23_028686 [Adineta vaga]